MSSEFHGSFESVEDGQGDSPRKSSGSSKRSGKSANSSGGPRSTVSFDHSGPSSATNKSRPQSGALTKGGSVIAQDGSTSKRVSVIAFQDRVASTGTEGTQELGDITENPDRMETSSSDGSENFGRKSMVITSLNRLSENKKRKSVFESNKSSVRRDVRRKSEVSPGDIQIPGATLDKTVENSLGSSDFTEDVQQELLFPPFAQLNTPNKYAPSFTLPPSELPPRSTKLTQVPVLGGSQPLILEDWYLDDNGFSNEAKKTETCEQLVEQRGPIVPIVPPKTPIPGLKPHPVHHHSHYPEYLDDHSHKNLAFCCSPQTPTQYAEVTDAENSVKRRNRPQYTVPTTIFGKSVLNSHDHLELKESLQLDNVDSTSITTNIELQIKGKSLQIVPLNIGAGSVGLGLSWSPAPPKLSLPLKVYQHLHSLPETPRSVSRQSKGISDRYSAIPGAQSNHPSSYYDQINEDADDEDESDRFLSYSEMMDSDPTQTLGSRMKPIRMRAKTPLTDIPYEEPTLETMLINEEEWIQTDSVIIPNTDPNNLGAGDLALSDLGFVVPEAIAEEEREAVVLEKEDEDELSKLATSVESPPQTVSDTPMESKADIQQVSNKHEPNAAAQPHPKVKIRQHSSDTEATKKVENPSTKKRSLSQQPPQKISRKRLAPLPPLPKKKAKKVSRVASTSSISSAGSTMQLNGMESTQSLQIQTFGSSATIGMSHAASEDPMAFYKKRRLSQSNQSVSTTLSYNSIDRSDSYIDASTSSFMRSIANSTFSIAGKKDVSNHPKQAKEKSFYTEAVGPNWYELIHNTEKRMRLYSPGERSKYPTFTDAGPPEELSALEGDVYIDPLSEIEKVTSLILSSNLPIPAFLRRRGILLGRVGRYDEAMSDLMRALQFDPFHSDALWHRHQLYLRLGDTDRALKDLDGITDTNKSHYGAFLAKARIYEELTAEERNSGLPLEMATLGLIKLAIVNFSQLIRLKPEDAEGYYHRACLFEAENEMVYANEDFRMVRQLDPSNEHAIHNLAVYSFQRQLWDDGIQAFTKLIKLNPENGQAYLYRGRANAYLAKWDEALRDLTLAIQLAPDRADVFFYRGCLLRDRNKRKAIEDLSVSVLLDDGPTNSEAFFQRAMLYYKLKKYELAVIDYLTVVELDSTKALAWLNLGILYMRFFNDYFKALDCFDKSILQDPIQIKAFLCRGDLLQILHSEFSDEFADMIGTADKKKRGKSNATSVNYLDRAIRDYSKAMHLCPSDYLLYLYRGKLLLKQGRMKDATYDFYSAFELNPGIAKTFMQRALVLSFQRKYHQIIEEFNERVKRERIEDPSLYILVAKARIKVGDNEGAIKDLAKALEFSRVKDPQIYLQKGICFENIKDYANASSEFTKCIALDPNFAKAYYHRGVCKLHEGNSKGALDLDMAIKLDPKYFDAYLSRGSYNQSKGQYVEGIEDCNSALKLEPTSIRAHLLRGACNCKIHQYGLAISDFTRAIHLDKTCNAAFYNRAVTYQLLEDYKNAIKDYSIVLLLCDDSNAYRNRGLIYWKQGDAENALLDLYAARDNFPGDARLHGLLALCLQKVGRTDESLEAFTSSIRVNQTLIEAYLGRGNVYSSIGQCKAAKRDYARVIHLYPTCTEAYVNMAYTLQMEGRYQKSWDLFARAIAVCSGCTSALEGRAVINYIMRNYFGALMDITKAIEISPNNAEFLTNRAVIYAALGDRIKSLNDNKLAIKIDPHYALAYFNIANLYFSQSRWEAALGYYNKALEFDVEDDAAILNRGITKAQLNDTQGALEDLHTAETMNPNSIEVYFNRAQLFQKLGQYDKADADYSMVLKLSPHDETAYKQRGSV
ncbi:UNVERIFIED_CONTAM: cytochrome c oxidase subunit 1, partial [Siphonaria sp. JEL0065]